MTNRMKVVALGAMTACVAVCSSLFAQDDLDALLKDLDAGASQPAVKTEPKVEEPKAEEPKVEEAKAEAAPAQASTKSVDEVLSLLDSLAAENGAPASAPAAAPVEAPAVEAPAVAAPAAASAPVVVEAPAAQAASAAQAAPAAAPKTVQQPVNPDAELVANIRATEKLRREALDQQAKREIADARACMSDAEYSDAVRHYGLALKLLNDRPASKMLRKECNQGIAEGLYRAALQEDELGRRDQAQKLMEKALDMRHPRARKVLEKWVAEGARTEESVVDSEIKQRRNDDDYKMSRQQILRHLRRSRQYLGLLDMDRALEECEIVLVNDPYNRDAIRLRNAIQRKRKVILAQEREAARDGMIADVDEKWRPVYAVNAKQLDEKSSETLKAQAGEDPERTAEQDIERRMKEMMLPTVSFKPPATIIDAVEFFKVAAKDYDRPDIPIEKRGFNFVIRTPETLTAAAPAANENESEDFTANANNEGESAGGQPGVPIIPTISTSNISLYEALNLVCESVGYKFIIRGSIITVMHKDMSTSELLSRKYNVPEAFIERVNSASDEVKQLQAAGGFGGQKKQADDGEENQERDWKEFFTQMGVKWPEGSSITHIKALGKLYVRNTRENLSEFEKVLEELGATPPLIEIETRFVEVSQEDLNSLGFEWILNSDYSLDVGSKLGKALGIKKSTWGSESGSRTWNSSESTSLNGDYTSGADGLKIPGVNSGTDYKNTDFRSSSYNKTIPVNSVNGQLIRDAGSDRNIGINAFGGTSDQQNGNRYLSTVGNHISGQSASVNDQFMRVNAFLGQADLSMILHMLSQRSDTDLLSAPKVVTRSGEQAVIKVVTEYIYPQDYDVQLQSSSSGSSGGTSGGGQSAILAVVEPQNFTMREQGVILDVMPTYSEANGGTIDLELKPSVVDEPIWHNYGMRIPFTGNTSSGTMADIGNIFTGMATALTTIGATLTPEETSQMAKTVVDSAMYSAENVSTSSGSTMTWYDAPMEQPFFHVRSIDSKVSITPGSTVVMGGLITESRKAMDDKIPFLGDLPYVGRLFRSHAEQTVKRNLLIFVTGRLITPSGRELRLNEEQNDEAEVKAAPKAE